MPAGDGTGPMGMGPTTGRGAGYCTGETTPGLMRPMPGRARGLGFGRGRGGGRHGWRHQFNATGLPCWARAQAPEIVPPGPPPVDEVRALKNRAAHLDQTLEQLRQCIADLEAARAKED